MLALKGIALPTLPILELKWVQDLEYYDGPLLSLFKHHRHGDSYLYYWCDRDEHINRWMVLRVSETSIIRLVNRLLPLDKIVPSGSQDDFVYFVDMDGDCVARNVLLVALTAIPPEYTPDQGVFLSADITEQDGRYSVVIERNLSLENWRDFFKQFSYAYAFLYNVIMLKSQRIIGHPWRGGFSAMHFWPELLSFIPAEDYPSLDTLQYASPGFIRFKVNTGIAVRVGNLIEEYIRSGKEINNAFDDLNAFIRTHKLNDESLKSDDPIWNEHNPELIVLTEALLVSLGIPSVREFMDAANRPFEAAKMATSFTRRIRELAIFEMDRIIRFPVTSPHSS